MMGMVGSGSSVLRAMSCHPEFKCNLEIARKGEERRRETERSISKAAGSLALTGMEIFVHYV